MMQDYVVTRWEDCARALGQALSRYNGRTNSPKLNLVTGIIVGDREQFGFEKDWFGEKAFCYAHEIIGEFKRHVGKKSDDGGRSAEALLHHAITFGFLYRAMPGGTMRDPALAKRVESTSHIALTPLGRALRSSKGMSNELGATFARFLWEYAVLECDFDLYGLLIKSASNNGGKILLQDAFFEAYYATRKKKYDWLMETFPNVMLRDQVGRSVRWLPRRDHKWHWGDPLPKFEGQTPGHHYKQRKNKWAVDFWRHMDRNGNLTNDGQAFAACLPPTDCKPFFWLAPYRDVVESKFVKFADANEMPCAPAWNILLSESKPELDSGLAYDELLDDLVRYMLESFDSMRLHEFRQAPLIATLPYLHYLERKMGFRVNEHATFRKLFAKYRTQIVCELRKDLSRSHYWISKK